MSISDKGRADGMWRDFFLACVEVLPPGARGFVPEAGASWCAYTTFSRLRVDAGYWTSGLPRPEDIYEGWIGDGGNWGQPIAYSDLAHVIIPRRFAWERTTQDQWESSEDVQDIDAIAAILRRKGIEHRLTEHCLERKTF